MLIHVYSCLFITISQQYCLHIIQIRPYYKHNFWIKGWRKKYPRFFQNEILSIFLTSSGWLLRYSHTPWYLYSTAYLQTWLLCNISSFILRLNGTVLTRHHLGHTESACRMAVGSGETYIMWHSEEIIIQHGILITQRKQYRGIVK